jgi:nitrate reductase NapE component
MFSYLLYHNQEVDISGFLAQDLSIIGVCVHQKNSVAESGSESKSKQWCTFYTLKHVLILLVLAVAFVKYGIHSMFVK